MPGLQGGREVLDQRLVQSAAMGSAKSQTPALSPMQAEQADLFRRAHDGPDQRSRRQRTDPLHGRYVGRLETVIWATAAVAALGGCVLVLGYVLDQVPALAEKAVRAVAAVRRLRDEWRNEWCPGRGRGSAAAGPR
jgi:hypothetical protein